jgi:hypothetical protein
MTILSFKAKETSSPDEMFNEFWNAYPKRVGKGQARKAFALACKIASASEIVSGAIRFADHAKEQGTAMRFIPHPTTWLNGERWEDELWQDEQGWGDFDEF